MDPGRLGMDCDEVDQGRAVTDLGRFEMDSAEMDSGREMNWRRAETDSG
jgi:hypothetical protein